MLRHVTWHVHRKQVGAARDMGWEAGGRGGHGHCHRGDVDHAGDHATAPATPGAVGAAHAVKTLLVARAQAAHQTGVVVVVADDDAVDVVVLWRDGQPVGLTSANIEACKRIVEPGVGGQRGHAGSEGRVHCEALSDQVLALGWHSVAEPQLGAADLLVALEGDVAADHVIEEDAQAPHRGQLPVVAVVSDPLWRRVDPGPVEVCVDPVLEEGPGPEINQLQLERLEVHQEVFILDVPVDDALAVTSQNSLDDLSKIWMSKNIFWEEIENIFQSNPASDHTAVVNQHLFVWV